MVLKVVLCGDYNSGKSTLCDALMYKPYELCAPTIGASFTSINHPTTSQPVQFWDTAGQDRFGALLPLYFRGANTILYCISNETPFNFHKVDALLRLAPLDVFVYVVNTKIDINDPYVSNKTVVYKVEERDAYCVEKGYKQFYVSSKTGEGIDGLREDIFKGLVNSKPRAGVTFNLEFPEKRRDCCWM